MCIQASSSSDKYASSGHGATTPTTTITITRFYLIIWCMHYLQPCLDVSLLGPGSGGLDVRPLVAADQYFLPAVVTTLLLLLLRRQKLAVPAAFFCHVFDLIIRVDRLPTVWDHEIWGLFLNVGFVACHSAFRQDTSAETGFLTLARLQLSILYAAATFWKLNSSFLNPTTSCGTVLILELLGTYLPVQFWNETVTRLLIQVAPVMTLLVEFALAIGFGYVGIFGTKRSPTIRDGTALLASCFHLSIFLMPVNTAGGFSLECMTRVLLLWETNELQAILQYFDNESRLPLIAVSALLTAILVQGRQAATGVSIEVGFVFASVLVALYTGLVMVGRNATCRSPSTTIGPNAKKSLFRRLVLGSVLFWTIFYAFATPILGIMQQSAPTMYANLRNFRGGNHYLVPTAILGEGILYGGGLLQVVASTSWSMNAHLGHIPSTQVFPERVNDILSPRIRSEDGMYVDLPFQLFPMYLYNPHSRQVLLDDYLTVHPYNGSTLLTPMILPVSTLRNTLQQAQSRKETYVVDFAASLDPNPSEIVRLFSDGKCQQVVNGRVRGQCGSENNPVVEWLSGAEETTKLHRLWQPILDKLLVPYPELVDYDEEMCMS